MSDALINFLDCCFALVPTDRYTASQLLSHPFLQEEVSPEKRTDSSMINLLDQDSIPQQFLRFVNEFDQSSMGETNE